MYDSFLELHHRAEVLEFWLNSEIVEFQHAGEAKSREKKTVKNC